MKPHPVHQFVHDKGGAGHITSIFQYGNEEEQDQDIRKERADTAHARNDTVDNQVLEDAVRQDTGEDLPQPTEETLQPRLRVCPQRERHLEHKPKEENQDWKP